MAIDRITTGAVLDGAIATADIADDAVTGAKIENNPTIAGNLTVNRSGNGVAQTIQSSGTTIGKIGISDGDNLFITGQTGNTGGIFMNDAAVSPAYQGAERDNHYDLGKTPARWKDLYLSGGLKVGGTGAANTLDDYEEGVFDPTIEGESPCTITHSARAGYYTKVGRLVNVQISLTVGSVSNASSGRAISFGGLPFTTNNQQNVAGALRLQSLGAALEGMQVIAFNNSTGGRIEEFNGSGGTNASDHVQSGTTFDISLTYSTA